MQYTQITHIKTRKVHTQKKRKKIREYIFRVITCIININTHIKKNAKYTIKAAVQVIQDFDFGEDTCNICPYIKKRMQDNNIPKIMSIKRSDISPTVHSYQPTIASVERPFSMLQKFLAKNRSLWKM